MMFNNNNNNNNNNNKIVNKLEFAVAPPQSGSSSTDSRWNLEVCVSFVFVLLCFVFFFFFVFCGGRKTGKPGEKSSEQGREGTTNSNHIWHRDRESIPCRATLVGGKCPRHCAIPASLSYLASKLAWLIPFRHSK